MIVTKTDVDCQFYAADLVAEIAGVAPPTQAEKDRLVRDLPSQFGSLRTEQQHLTRAELRLANLRMAYDSIVKTRAAVIADIRKRVHSAEDVSRESRRIENDVQYGSKYHHLYRTGGLDAIARASRVNVRIIETGRAIRLMMRR
jgi:hypothetical protein